MNNQKGNYKEYLDEHRRNVNLAYHCIHEELHNYLNFSDEDLKERIQKHDMSRYSKEEFEPFRQHIFPYFYEYEKDINSIANATKHHFLNEDHHANYWLEKEEEMPDVAIAEMLCNWLAHAIQNKYQIKDWYKERDNGIFFLEETRKKVEQIVFNTDILTISFNKD